MKDYNFSGIEDIVKEKCGEDILLHSKRTRDIALILRYVYGGDETVINLSTLLHDITINENFSSHAKRGSEIVREIFRNEWDPSLLKEVCYCIEYHSITSPTPKEKKPELICVHDADKIDFLLTTSSTNTLYSRVLRSFLGKESFVLYNTLSRLIKWYKK